MSGSSTERVCQLLLLTTSNNNPERKKAESDLEALARTSSHCAHLLLIASATDDVEVHLRRLALIILKGVLRNHWKSIRGDERGPLFEQLFCLCRDPSIRVLACAALSWAIAMDPSTHWNVFQGAMGSLAEQSAEAAIELVFACTEVCGPTELITLLPIMRDLLWTCLQKPSEYSTQLAASFKSLKAMLELSSSAEEMQMCCVQLFPHLTTLLTCEVTVDNVVYVQEAAPLARNMLLYDMSNSLIGNITVDFIQNLIGSLNNDFPKMEPALDEMNAVQESEALGALVRCLGNKLDLFRLLIADDHFKQQVTEALDQHFVPLVTVLLKYSVLSLDQVNLFEEDYSKFLEAEDNRNDGDSGELRDTALVCIRAALTRFGLGFLNVLEGAIQECLALDMSDSKNWRAREAAVTSLQFALLAGRSRAILERSGQNRQFCESLCGVLLSTDLTANAPSSVLTARALLFFRLLMKHPGVVSVDYAVKLMRELLDPCIVTLSSANRLLASCSCHLLLTLVKLLSRSDYAGELVSRAEACIDATNKLFCEPNLVGDPLYVVIHLATSWLAKCHVRIESAAFVPKCFMECWQRNQSDPFLGTLALGVLKAILTRAESEEGISQFIRWMMPVLQGVGGMAATCCTPAIIDLVSLILNKGNDRLCFETCQRMIAPMCQLLLTCDDDSTAIIANGTKCLVAMMKRYGDDLSNASVLLLPSVLRVPPGLPSDNEQPVQIPVPRAIIAVVNSVLSETKPDNSLLNIEEFLLAVIQVMGKRLQEDELRQFVAAAANRVTKTNADLALERLVTPLSTIMVESPDWMSGALDVIVQAEITPHFFGAWLNAQSGFTRARSILVTSKALMALLEVDALRGYDVMLKTLMESRRAKKTKVKLRVAIFVALAKTALAVKENREELEDDYFEEDDEADDTGTYGDAEEDDRRCGGSSEEDNEGDGDRLDRYETEESEEPEGGITPVTGGSNNGQFPNTAGGGNGGDDGEWVDETPYQRIMAVLSKLREFAPDFREEAARFFTPKQFRDLQELFSE